MDAYQNTGRREGPEVQTSTGDPKVISFSVCRSRSPLPSISPLAAVFTAAERTRV